MLHEMSASDREKWNRKYSRQKPTENLQPDDWLTESCRVIADRTADSEQKNQALDIACGLGHNSIWLAQNGWEVDGVDISPAGLAAARETATQSGCTLNWREADLDDWLPGNDSYDLAIVFRFLDRTTVPKIVDAGLRSGGWLIYETFAASQLDRPDSHIHNPAFTLARGELPTLFPDYEIIEFREESLDDRSVQRLLARRR